MACSNIQLLKNAGKNARVWFLISGFLLLLSYFASAELIINPISESIESQSNTDLLTGFIFIYQDLNAPSVSNLHPTANALDSNAWFSVKVSDFETGLQYCQASFFKNGVFQNVENASENFDIAENFGTCTSSAHSTNAGETWIASWHVCDWANNCIDLNSNTIASKSIEEPEQLSGLNIIVQPLQNSFVLNPEMMFYFNTQVTNNRAEKIQFHAEITCDKNTFCANWCSIETKDFEVLPKSTFKLKTTCRPPSTQKNWKNLIKLKTSNGFEFTVQNSFKIRATPDLTAALALGDFTGFGILFLQNYWWLMLAVIAGLIIAFVLLKKRKKKKIEENGAEKKEEL